MSSPRHSSAPRLLGAVLAGGGGRRMGGPKADVTLGGKSLVSRAVATLLRASLEEVVVVSSRLVPEVSVTVVADRVDGAGPLAGLEAALLTSAARGLDGVLLLACDLPLVDAALLRRVAQALAGNLLVAPERTGGWIEPLCAAYSLQLLPAVTRRLDEQDRSLHALFAEVGGVALSTESLGIVGQEPFLNVNRPEDLVRAEAALAGRSTS